MHEEYKSFSELGDGTGLLKLMDILLGMSPSYSSRPWDQIEDLLIIADKEDDIKVEDLKGSKEEVIVWFWLFDTDSMAESCWKGKYCEAPGSWGDIKQHFILKQL